MQTESLPSSFEKIALESELNYIQVLHCQRSFVLSNKDTTINQTCFVENIHKNRNYKNFVGNLFAVILTIKESFCNVTQAQIKT